MKAGAIAVRINRKFYIKNRPCVRSGDFHFAKKSRIVGLQNFWSTLGLGSHAGASQASTRKPSQCTSKVSAILRPKVRKQTTRGNPLYTIEWQRYLLLLASEVATRSCFSLYWLCALSCFFSARNCFHPRPRNYPFTNAYTKLHRHRYLRM